MVGVGIDMLFLLLDYNRMSRVLSGNGVMMFLYWMIVVYNLVAFILAYRTWKCYKHEFYMQHGVGYSMFGGRDMAEYDDEDRRYGGHNNNNNVRTIHP